ncbi:MAG: Ig-like domain-containing protein [Lachnospiraceae bacterium]|nr:Ig-like domain-containing protein [Lachnospiraceae bacterium]
MKKIRKKMIAAVANLSLMAGMFYFPVEASGVDTIEDVQEEVVEEITEDLGDNLSVPGNSGWKEGTLATAEWDAVEGADYYDIVVRVYQGDTLIGERETGTSVCHADLQQEIRNIASADAYMVNVEFKVRARVIDTGVTGEYTEYSEKKDYYISAMESIDAPSEVILVKDGDQLLVYFTPVENADHYKVSSYIVQNNVGIGGSIETNDGVHGIDIKNGYCVVDISEDFDKSYESYIGEEVEVNAHVQAVSAEGNESESTMANESLIYKKDSILPTPNIKTINKTEDGRVICTYSDETEADDYDIDIVFKNFISGEEGTERDPNERTTRLGERMSRLCGVASKNNQGNYAIDILPVLRYWLHYMNAVNPTAPADVEVRIRSISGNTISAFSNMVEIKDLLTEPYYVAPENVVLTETEDGKYKISFDKAGDAPNYLVDFYVYKEGGRAQNSKEVTAEQMEWDGNRGTIDLTEEFIKMYNDVRGDSLLFFNAVVRGKSADDVERGLRSEYSNKVRVYPFNALVNRLTLSPEIPVIAEGKSIFLGKTVSPDDGYYENVAWSSEDESIATVDQMGKVTGVTAGHTVITAVVDEVVRSSVSVNVYELESNLEDVSGGDSVASQAEDLIDDIANKDNPDISKTDISSNALEKIRDEICDGAVNGDSFHTDIVSEEKNIEDYEDELDEFEKVIGDEISKPKDNGVVSDNSSDCVFVCGYDVSIQVYHKSKAGRQYRVANIVETNEDIKFFLEIPKNMHWTTGGDFSFCLLREHDGVVEKIPVAVNADGSFSIESNKFSDFVLVALSNKEETDTEKKEVKPESISLNKAELTLDMDGTEQLIASITPDDVSNKGVIWSTSDDGLVTVDEKGNVKALKVTNTPVVITATAAADSKLKAECKVTVTEKNVRDNDEVTVRSKEDVDTYVVPRKEVVSENKLTLKLEKNNNVTVNIPLSYTTAVTFQNRSITLSDLGISVEMRDILKAANLADKDPATLMEVKAVFKNNRNATVGVTKDSKKSSFYVKLSVKKDAKNTLNKQEFRALKKTVNEANKALKKQRRFFTINKASLADLNTKAYFKNGKVDITAKGAVKGLKKVTVTINGEEKKLPPSQFDKKNMKPDKEQNKVTVTGKKNYTGSVTVKVQ